MPDEDAESETQHGVSEPSGMATGEDEPATLRERVRDLENTVTKQQETIQQLMPSRRAILAGGAGLVGGAALTGQASAQSAAGQVGTASEPVDVEAATINADSASVTNQLDAGSVNADSASVTNQLDAGSVNTELAGGIYRHAAAYSGSDNDARLDNALAAASPGDIILLENKVYTSSHTVGRRVRLVSYTNAGARFDGGLTIDERCHIDGLRIASTLTINDLVSFVTNVALFGGSIEVASNQNVLTRIIGGSVTFQSGTTSNIIDSSSSVNITDNGSGNVIGDIA